MLTSALIYLCAAVLAVPIAKRLGLGSVLGYLLAGVFIGPFALKLVGDQTAIMHFAEFGVVMMLFLIGLELRPERLWQLRRPILGLGGLQVLISTLFIGLTFFIFADHPWQTALAVGLSLALSSTAIVIQSLNEKGWFKTQAGNNAFSVLLFQDIAVIPILALLPILAVGQSDQMTDEGGHASVSLLAGLPLWVQITATFFVMVAIVLAGRFLSPPVFRFIADTRLQEVFTAFALLIVIAIAVLMTALGLSPALGSFLAGVVLAESEFRHELEVNIQPFKGLLLGLFFITVGASIDFQLVIDEPKFILMAVAALVLTKFIVLAILASGFKMGWAQGALFTLCLAQGGEFAFVLVTTGLSTGVFDAELANTINVVVALSMLITPLFIVLYDFVFNRPNRQQTDIEEEHHIEPTNDVIIAGYGRFGQIVGRLLRSHGFHTTILDPSPSQIALLRRFGSQAYYGDPSRKEVLEAAGAHEAKLLVVAADQADKTRDIILMAQKHFPHLKIISRAYDRRQAYELMALKVDAIRRETFDSAIYLGIEALMLMGIERKSAKRAGKVFREHDQQSLHILAQHWGDDKSYGAAVRQRQVDLERVLQQDLLENEELEKAEEDSL